MVAFYHQKTALQFYLHITTNQSDDNLGLVWGQVFTAFK